ncbi:hypothetical protein MNBD_GAMMA08-1317 [hydrothermal vent metagenome]|uniref:Lipoprotein n=1 Tax=hydrothermal vent metagenome TaxID=652676 RepID=A0A3B0XV64_9ZZZZ
MVRKIMQFGMVILILFLTACSAGITNLNEGYGSYQWKGEHYGIVEVNLSDELKGDDAVLINKARINFQTHIIARLVKTELYDIKSKNKILVTINQLHFKSGYIPPIARTFTGPDVIAGEVKLIKGDKPLASFDVKIEYGKSSRGSSKYTWVGRKFAQLLINFIINPQ